MYELFNLDNLYVLQRLPENFIDLVYCNILYNTGKNFKEFNANLGSPQEAIEICKKRLNTN